MKIGIRDSRAYWVIFTYNLDVLVLLSLEGFHTEGTGLAASNG